MGFHQKDNPRYLARIVGTEGSVVKYRVPGFPYVAGMIPRSLFLNIFEETSYVIGFQAEDWWDCTFWHNGRVFLIYFTKGQFHLDLSGTVLLKRPEAITIPEAVAFLALGAEERRKLGGRTSSVETGPF